ncbi:hypothetical protein [Planococcus sp. YIM B11945]|uniref:hypothetical protein n=1 Tax=Planococcus sp. YIM B11945 TaxID=3435410 RepID=UPI003D7E67C0
MDKQTGEFILEKAKKHTSFIKGMLSRMGEAKQELNALNIIEHENPDKMFELNYERMMKEIGRSMESQKNHFRYPA